MKCLLKSRSCIILILCLSLALSVSCENDTASDSETKLETAEQIATKEKLIGDWKLISSKVDGELMGTEDFAQLKESSANFSVDNTYKVTYKKASNASTSTSTLSGTYMVEGLNRIVFFNSVSKIELVGETLQITSTNSDNKTQVDIFIRTDNDEFEADNNSQPDDIIIVDEKEDNASTPDNSFDGSELIAKLQGVWKISGIENDCAQKNTIEFKTSDLLVFTQHDKSFNRADLTSNNINVSYPMPAKFSATVTKGFNTVTFNTEAECQFIKASKLHYTITDAQTILINEVTQLTIKVVNDNTINLIYKYTDKDSKELLIQNSFNKL